MSSRRGMIALMGSGELTSTMVEVHKELLAAQEEGARAVFLDTPAGFQLNADDLSRRALTYFDQRVQHRMDVVSYKSKALAEPLAAEQAFDGLRRADYILIGPGSPTYAVRQWIDTPIPGIFTEVVQRGGCLVAASAAALTMGRHTLPVYEIYKVGEEVHWAPGLDILKRFGFDLVVIPHWNNAEGGTHDTRYCYMGAPRFRQLETLLPETCGIVGLEEHTACVLDFEKEEAAVRGIGRIVVRHGGREVAFAAGDRFPLNVLCGGATGLGTQRTEDSPGKALMGGAVEKGGFWARVQASEERFRGGVERIEPRDIVAAMLDLDGVLWDANADLESPEFLAQGRERFREMIVRTGTLLEGLPRSRMECLDPLMQVVLDVRDRYRRAGRWHEADVVRDMFAEARIVIEDTSAGSRWRLK